MAVLTSEELMSRAATSGVRVQWADLRGCFGLYEDDRRVILLDLCLTEYQTRSTMAHELSHALWRDRPTANLREHERRERRADAEAARDLISASEYALAEKLVGPDPGALAEELGVSKWVIEVWQREARVGREWTCAHREPAMPRD